MMSKIIKQTSKGVEAFQRGRYGEALRCFTAAHELASRVRNRDELHTTKYNLALTYYSLDEFAVAERLYRQLPETHHDGKYEQALCLFHLGRVAEAARLYDHRVARAASDAPMFPRLPLPVADTLEELRGKRVLVLNEQGFGDELMFYRALPRLSQIAAEVTAQVYPELFRVFNTSLQLSGLTFFDARSLTVDLIERHDVWIPSGSLWAMLTGEPPLELQPVRRSGAARRVGFTQSPNVRSKNAERRAVPVSFFENLSTLYELHHLGRVGPCFEFAVDHRDELHDFQDTLDLLKTLDAVVTVDTGVAHLAACHGIPTTLVYDAYLDWRWVNNFYPTVRAVRYTDYR